MYPPFPGFQGRATRSPHLPLGASDDRGRNVLPQLLKRDHQFVTGLQTTPFAGFAKLHWLESIWATGIRRILVADPRSLHGLFFRELFVLSMASRAEADSALHRSSSADGHWHRVGGDIGFFSASAHHDRRPHWKTSAGHAQDSHRHQPENLLGSIDRGGDLLCAVRLAYLIEDAFGEDMPLSALFEAQTVVGLAALMRIRASARTTSVDRHPSLVVIRHGTSARPLFIVPGGHGGPVEVALYSRLLRPLEGGRAIYCLRDSWFRGKRAALGDRERNCGGAPEGYAERPAARALSGDG